MNQQPLPGAGTVLTMGILSVVGALVCCGPFAIIFSIIGLAKAKSAKELYIQNPQLYSGYESLTTGRILSYVGLGLSLLMLVIVILYFGVIFAMLTSGQYDFQM
jgi:hypothetical protein